MNKTQSQNGLAHARAQQRAAMGAITPSAQKGEPLPRGTEPVSQLRFKSVQYFRTIVDSAPPGHFLLTDLPAIEEYCELLAKLDTCRQEFRDAKLTLPGRSGPVRNPVIVAYLTLERRAAVLRNSLRLQPSMRAVTSADRAAQNATPVADTQPSGRAHLLFGGARANARLRADENDQNEDEE